MGCSSLKMFVSKAFLRTLHPYSLYCSRAGRGARRDRHMQKQLFDSSPPPWVGVQSRPTSLQKVITCFLPLPTPWPGSKSRSVSLSPWLQEQTHAILRAAKFTEERSEITSLELQAYFQAALLQKGQAKGRSSGCSSLCGYGLGFRIHKRMEQAGLQSGGCFKGVWINPPP